MLVAHKRDVHGKKNAKLRAEGKVPAVVYGHDVKSESLALDARELERVYHRAGGNKIIDLKVGEGAVKSVLIHDVQHDAQRGHLLHADLYVVRMDEELTTEVPLHFVGESTAVYQQEGSLLKDLDTVTVECLPGDLPESIEVDISVLDDFEKTITVADLAVPKGVKFLDDPETLVAKVEAPRSDEEMAELDEEVAQVLPEGVEEEAPTVVREENEGDKDRRDKK